MAIREGFDRLTELVPGIEGMGRSESLVLARTVEYMKGLMGEEEELRRRVGELGGRVDGVVGSGPGVGVGSSGSGGYGGNGYGGTGGVGMQGERKS